VSISILTLRLLDVKIPNNKKLMTIFYNGMLKLTEENSDLFTNEDIPIDIFHNDRIEYSGIHFSRYNGAVEFTALGDKEVRALEIWYCLFHNSINNVIQNIQKIYEVYLPVLTERYIYYTATNLLIKKEIAGEIEEQKNSFAVSDRLEKYLYGNIKAFLILVAGMNLGANDFISVKVRRFEKKGLKNTFHGGKLQAYDIEFSANVYLPQTLRLGQAVALGYGKIMHK